MGNLHATPKNGRKTAIIIGVVAVVLVALTALFMVGFGGLDKLTSSGKNAGNYVDTSGMQNHELDVAPGDPSRVNGMTLTINGRTAEVDPIQVTDTGMLVPPQDVQRLGWYSASAVPGESGAVGSSVITGHVNYEGQGEGFAYQFTQLNEGDEVVVVHGGETHKFKVTRKPYRIPKTGQMPPEVNDFYGSNSLVMVTCGGAFVGGPLGYADNIVTIAEPVQA
ncbi:class F sortase [Corynebacterium atypicum]|nr:class F sortase [Corynebacterium atypicum]